MNDTSNSRKFRIFDWGSPAKEDDSWDSKHFLIKLVKKYLISTNDWDETDNTENAELIIISPAYGDKLLSIDDLNIFSYCTKNHGFNRVLYIHPLADSGYFSEIFSEWCFIIKKSYFSWHSLRRWIDSECPKRKPICSIELNQIREYIALSMDPKKADLPYFNESVEGQKKGNLLSAKYLLECLLEETERFKFLYALLSVGGSFSTIEHAINAAQSLQESDFNPEELFESKNFISACNDVYCSLRAITMRPHPSQNYILLIDDNPKNINPIQLYGAISSTFLKDFRLVVWNPRNLKETGPPEYYKEKKRLLLRDLESYQSVKQSSQYNHKLDILEKWMNIREVDNNGIQAPGKAKPCVFLDILKQTRFVLVDILFKDSNGHDYESGHGVIRGIHRLCRDFRSLDDSKAGIKHDHNSRWTIPAIFAISHADHIDKAQTAFSSGAAGFIPKTRLFSLPGILAKCRNDFQEPAHNPHSNFHSLYRLPKEIIGLLRTTFVPKIRFDNSMQGELKEITDQLRYRKLALIRFLSICPKCDLHVHIGSCMTPEFLIVSSIVMLLRHSAPREAPSEFRELRDSFLKTIKFWDANADNSTVCERSETLYWECLDDLYVYSPIFCYFELGCNGIKKFASRWRAFLMDQIDHCQADIDKYAKFRSTLDKGLGIPGHWNETRRKQAIEEKLDMEIFLFGMAHSGPCGKPLLRDKDDILRIYILYLGSKYNKLKGIRTPNNIGLWSDFIQKALNFESWKDEKFREGWDKFHKCLYMDTERWSAKNLQQHNWSHPENAKLSKEELENDLTVAIDLGHVYDNAENLVHTYENDETFFDKDPIGYSLATGTRASNLKEYLDGCEFSGAEHLRHPYLIHLYAQQTVFNFVKTGVIYAEMRAAISGYENLRIDFGFKDACDCMTNAFGHAQKMIRNRYCGTCSESDWIWEHPFSVENAFSGETGGHFPVKVNLVLTGKRHKPTSEMIRESSAGVVLNSRPPERIRSAADLLNDGFGVCQIVGFDLAGPEENHPPLEFRSEYERVARMNIPITAHAGENAPNAYVESAMHDLRARRLGHGLSLADNPQLMNRAREDGVCIELCPVSNFQTNPFAPATENRNSGGSNLKEYPLRRYLENGNVVCLNTDNPVISNTNMIKECFQASYAYGGVGLSLWELFRIFRMGFTKAFLNLPDRSAMLELTDQIIFDLCSRDDVISLLKVIMEETPNDNSN